MNDEKKELRPVPLNDPMRCIRSEEIFQGKREVSILHGDCKYRLQITKAGKLILTK